MIFNSKQLEELENIHDSTGAFEEEGEDDGNFEEIGEAAMDWRRGLIEEAAENIKRAKTRPVEPHLTYPIGSMLFEREARRFARVQRSVPGYLKIVYLSGGDREFGTLDVTGYLKDQGAEKRLSELSEQLGMSDFDVGVELERLGITPVEELEGEEGEAVAAAGVPAEIPMPPLPVKKGKAAAVVVEEEEEVEADVVDDLPVAEVPVGKGKKGATATAAKSASTLPQAASRADLKNAPRKVAPGAGEKAGLPGRPGPVPGKKAAAQAAGKGPEKLQKAAKPADKPEKKSADKGADKGADKKGAPAKASSSKINPIDDPNGYIKANFMEMSNRELARVTGLSEHTIRRKLGEWSMKRKQ